MPILCNVYGWCFNVELTNLHNVNNTEVGTHTCTHRDSGHVHRKQDTVANQMLKNNKIRTVPHTEVTLKNNTAIFFNCQIPLIEIIGRL